MTATTHPSTDELFGSREHPVDVALAVQRVRIRLGLRLAWLSHLHSTFSDVEISSGDLDRVDDELAWREAAAPPELLAALAGAEDALDRADAGGRLHRLADMFGLTAAEHDLVQVCLAAAIDERIARQFAALHAHEDRRFPTEASAARLCDRQQPFVRTSESPLRLWRLLRTEPGGHGETPALLIDRSIAAWLLGIDELDHCLVGVAQRHVARGTCSTWPIAAIAERLASRTGADQPDPTRVVVRGPSGSGRRTFAAAVCDALGLGTLVVDVDLVPPDRWDEVVNATHRQAFLDHCGVVWVGDSVVRSTWTAQAPTFPVQFVIVESDETPIGSGETVDVTLDLPAPATSDREHLWATLVPASEAWPPEQRADLVERRHTVIGDIVHVGRSRPVTASDAADLLRVRSRTRIGSLVTPMPLPYRRADLILPARVEDSLDLLLFECRQRRTFWEGEGRGRLFPNDGLVALLAGPPGVGKTMAAQVVAHDLGVDLLRVNLAETISKYIGETAKNLDRVLREAAESDAVLLCDEADTLFGQRTEIRDAHDRWANADTNFLLQAIEGYPGIALLATNKRDQLDEAFVRRVRHVLDLPKPDRDARLLLWRSLVADIETSVEIDRFESLLERLAAGVETTGAEIKHAVLNAAFEARRCGQRLGPSDILKGLDRELSKQGRALSELERRRLFDE